MSAHLILLRVPFFFFFNDTATTEIYTLSLHDALPISAKFNRGSTWASTRSPLTLSEMGTAAVTQLLNVNGDRKSTRLNSSHVRISYAVFCLKKKKNTG